MVGLRLTPHTSTNLASFLPIPLRHNRHEVSRLIDYINMSGLLLQDVLEALFETRRSQIAILFNEDFADEHWGPNAWFCDTCIPFGVSITLYDWWVDKRKISLERQDGILQLWP